MKNYDVSISLQWNMIKLRKGERLVKYLSAKFPVLDRYEVQGRDARLIMIIMNMTDEEFERIINDKGTITEICPDCYKQLKPVDECVCDVVDLNLFRIPEKCKEEMRERLRKEGRKFEG